jgi:hypothetical protein
MVLPTFAFSRQQKPWLDLPLIDFEAISAQIYSPGRSEYPTLEGWKIIHNQVQMQLALISVTPGNLPIRFANRLDTLLDTVSDIYRAWDSRLGALAKEDPLWNRGWYEANATVHKTTIANINAVIRYFMTEIQSRWDMADKGEDAATIIKILQPLLIENK